MLAAPLPINEEKRIQDLYAYQILDTEEDQDFNHLVELAAFICQTDFSVINFIDKHRQWGKANFGLGDTTMVREGSMCAHTILQNDLFLVEDLLEDERFFDNPFTIEAGIRFYAGAPIRSPKGYNLGALCVCHTQPKTLNEEQKNAIRKLTQQAGILLEVRKQNKELQRLAITERELKQEADAARAAQEQFLSTMSHEIRTPLNGIIGIVEILQTEAPKPEQQAYINTLQFASKNLLSIVNDILDYNKITSGSVMLEEVEFSLPKLVDEVRKTHDPKAKEKGICLKATLDKGVPEVVVADPTRLTQILNNLIGNAVKFTLEGSVSLHVKPITTTAQSVDLLFEVKDTGIGFSKEQEQRIFEQFMQAHTGVNRQFGGTGLGLAITKKLVEAMGSCIQVASTPNVGSSFSFQLKLKAIQPTVVKETKEDSWADKLSGLSVLITEDNPINVMVTRKYLERQGVVVDEANNGEQAIAKLANKNYDLILMDMHMPVLDGVETVKKLRQEKSYTGPVLLMTADAIASKEVLDMGFNDVLLKPFHAQELYQKAKALTAV